MEHFGELGLHKNWYYTMVVSHQTLLRAGGVFNENFFLPGRWGKSSRDLGPMGFYKREGRT